MPDISIKNTESINRGVTKMPKAVRLATVAETNELARKIKARIQAFCNKTKRKT